MQQKKRSYDYILKYYHLLCKLSYSIKKSHLKMQAIRKISDFYSYIYKKIV